MELFGGTIRSLEKGLTYASAKQKVIAQNVANSDTPGYRAVDVKFKSTLSEEIKMLQAIKTNNQHFSFSNEATTPYIERVTQPQTYQLNGNGVDVEREMALLAENQIYFNALTDRINSKFSGLTNVIKGGK